MAEPFNPFAKPEYIREMARYRRLCALQKVYDGKQYDGRADWWTGVHRRGGEVVPLRERKPCVVYRLPKAMVGQVSRFLFGDSRFPRIKVQESKAIGDEQREMLQSWIAEFIEQASIKPASRTVAKRGIADGTAVAVIDVLDGQFQLSYPNAKDCAALFEDNDPSKPVVGFVWCYQFEKEVTGQDGKPCLKRHWFRRQWDETSVYTWDDIEVDDNADLEWPAPTVAAHGLTFCPVIWCRNEAESVDGVDGISLIDGLEEEFEALDMTLSKRHQGIIYLGAPQIVETGVEEGDGPDESGRQSRSIGYSAAPESHGITAPKARRLGPQIIWTYEGKDVSVQMLETTGKAFEVGTKHVEDIRSRILEQAGVVLPAMNDTTGRVTMGAEMSAKFLALLHAPLLALVSEYRETWWNEWLHSVLSMALRALVDLSAGSSIRLDNSEQVAAIARGFYSVENGKIRWQLPAMKPIWGRYFEPSTSEIKETVGAARDAEDGKLICKKTAVSHIAADFSIDDVEEELDEIADQAEEDRKNAVYDIASQTAATHQLIGSMNESPSSRGSSESDKRGSELDASPRGPSGDNAENGGQKRGKRR